MGYNKDQIDQFLKHTFFAVLSYADNKKLLSQLMIFGHLPDGVFYFISQNQALLFQSLYTPQDVSVLIYREEEELDDICQVNVLGKAFIIEDFDSEDAKLGYELIGEKSPLIARAREESFGDYTLIKLDSQSMSFITFEDIRKGIVPSYLDRFGSDSRD